MRCRWLSTGLFVLLAAAACAPPDPQRETSVAVPSVAATPTQARAADGDYISWREHIIDDEAVSGVPIRGSDGLVMADLDLDGHADVVSVHESDTTYDGVPRGHIRVAFGSADPTRWTLVTLAEGNTAGAAEDVAVADLNGDGFPDVVAACELAHLVYLENPGAAAARTAPWRTVIAPVTQGRGSFIRVFAADFDNDGRPEITAANKGAQNPDQPSEKHAISWFDVGTVPASGAWTEHVLTRVVWPINAQTVDLDGDGDDDVVGGSTGEARIFWFENIGQGRIAFVEHAIRIDASTVPAEVARPPRAAGRSGALVNGFNMDFADLDSDGDTDIVAVEWPGVLIWLAQPENPADAWVPHRIGDLLPDNLVGFVLADIDDDGDLDVMSGAYSRGSRDQDDERDDPSRSLGRIAWFENSGRPDAPWRRHDVSRRKRGMYDKFLARDMNGDGYVDFVGTRGNSNQYDGVFWLEQVRTASPIAAFAQARSVDSEQMPLPD